jgi:hypothetical protein
MANELLNYAANRAAFKAMKIGKTKKQKKVIDFFADAYGASTRGCLKKRSKMKIDEYEKMIVDRCNSLDIKQRALQRIGLDESEISEINPISLHSYVYTLSQIKSRDILLKIVKNTAVTSKYEVAWLFFSKDQIYAYTIEFDMISDEIVEDVHEFFYTDITCFETVNHLVEDIRFDLKGCLRTKGCLNATVKNNYVVDTFVITVPGKEYTVSMRNSGNQFQSVQAAKAMLREKKFAK